MQRSLAPHIELGHARDAIQQMRNAHAVDEFEEHWKHFLRRLERVWSKVRAHYGRSPKFGNWSASFEEARRKDPLLSYLCNARGAEEHTVTEITDREPGSIAIGLADGVGVQPDGSVLVKDLRISFGPDDLHVQSAQPLKFAFRAARIRMAAVTNRGRLYPVPAAHNGHQLDPNDLLDVANTALAFYANAVAAAEALFAK